MDDRIKQRIESYYNRYTEAYDECVGNDGISKMSFHQGLIYGYLFALSESGQITDREERDCFKKINDYGLNNE